MEKPEIYKNPQLDGSTFHWKSGENAILCLHGFTATTVEVRKMAQFLTENGYTTYGPLLPGHGTTISEANKATWRDWVKVAEDSYLFLKEEYENVFVLGESMGGLLSLYLCSKYPEIRGAMLFAPAIKINNLIFTKLLWPFAEYKSKNYTGDDDMPWQGYDVIPLKAAANVYDLQRQVKKGIQKVNSPVIIFQGKKDGTIDPMSSVYVLEHIGSTDKQLVWLEESSHVILLDQQLEDVEILCQQFISSHLSPKEPIGNRL